MCCRIDNVLVVPMLVTPNTSDTAAPASILDTTVDLVTLGSSVVLAATSLLGFTVYHCYCAQHQDHPRLLNILYGNLALVYQLDSVVSLAQIVEHVTRPDM